MVKMVKKKKEKRNQSVDWWLPGTGSEGRQDGRNEEMWSKDTNFQLQEEYEWGPNVQHSDYS